MSEGTDGTDITDAEIDQRDVLQVRQKIALGAAVDGFMKDDGGRMLQQLCNDDMQAALEKMAEHDVADAEGMRKLQLDYRSAAGVLHYLGLIVSEGEMAEQQFREADSAGG